MAGHILLLSCLLAIGLPVIFVQLPRFKTVTDLRAENEAEKRSEVLRRRRPLSPSRKILRRLTRPWSETDVDLTSAGSEQEQAKAEQIPQAGAGRRWHTRISRPIFQGDACAEASTDGRASSKKEELRKARAGKKPWDPLFRRQLPRTELVRKSPGGRWHVVTDAAPPCKTCRDLEPRCSLATSSGQPQTPQEPLHRRPPPKNQPQSHDERRSASPREHQLQPLPAQNISPGRAPPESLPSPLDGSPLPWLRHPPRSAPPARASESSICPCGHCRRSGSNTPVSRTQSSTSIPSEHAPKEATKETSKAPSCHCEHLDFDTSVSQLRISSPLVPNNVSKKATAMHHTCHCHTLLRTEPAEFKELPNTSHKQPDSGPAESQSQVVPSNASKDAPNPAHEITPEGVVKGPAKDSPKETAKKDPSKAPKSGLALWQAVLIAMGSIIFIFAFAILISHCLAWFLVYKTEARLGEVRSGLLRGGEMKLCLCGRG